jgi:hypothetical protein
VLVKHPRKTAGRARKVTAEGAEHHAVGGLEAGPTDQTFEDAKFEDADMTTEEKRPRYGWKS